MKQFGLSKIERIKSKKELSFVYSQGSILYSNDKSFKVNFYKIDNSEKPFVKAAFAVHKKAGIAVWRNRVKRLLREAYRLNKKKLIVWSSQNRISIYLVFSPSSINQNNNPKISLHQVMPQIKSIIDKVIRVG